MGRAGTSSFNFGPRLTLTFATLIVLILGGNALVVSQFHITRNETDRLTGANQQLIAVLRLQANLLSFHRRLDDLARSMDLHRLVTEAESLRRTLQEQTQQTRAAIANLPSGTVVDASFLPTLDTIDVTLTSEIEAILDLAKSGDWGRIQPRVGNELNPIETQTAILVNSINQQASEELARGVAEMSSVQRRILVIVPATALSTFFIAAFFGWSIARRFIELRLEERVAERTRLARDLHDTLLQSFQALMLHLEVVSNQLPEGKAKEQLEKTLERADQAIAEGRSAVYELRSSTTVTNEFSEAVNAVGNELSRDNDAAFGLVVEGLPRDLHPIIRDEFYRISREVLRNAFKHAHARHIEAEISYGERVFRLRIRDDGEGIPAEILEQGRPGHYGLSGIQERARQVGAELTIWSRAGSGTEIELSLAGSIAYSTLPRRSRFRLFGKKVG